MEWLARSLGVEPRDLTMTRMVGSTSSAVYLVRTSPGAEPYVLRVLDNQEWLAQESDLAAHEAAALEEAQKAGLRAPRLLANSTADVGFGGPVVLMSFIPGQVALRPADFGRWLDGLARELVLIHRHPATGFPWQFRSWVQRDRLAPPAWTAFPRTWERAIEMALGRPPAAREVFIHRDYHPTNVLWHEDGVSGVVDWINACRGPAGVDVAHCRTNLALMFGPAAARQFLDAYTRADAQFEYHPYWEVDSILNSCLPEPGFYKPWLDFGLDSIPPAVLRERIDNHLERVMQS